MNFVDIVLSSIGLFTVIAMVCFCVCAAVSISMLEHEFGTAPTVMIILGIFLSLIIFFVFGAAIAYLLRNLFCSFTGAGCF